MLHLTHDRNKFIYSFHIDLRDFSEGIVKGELSSNFEEKFGLVNIIIGLDRILYKWGFKFLQ